MTLPDILDYRIQEAYLKAYRYAAFAHFGQTYKSTNPPLPYIMHVSFVTMEMMMMFQNERNDDGSLKWDVESQILGIQCALLHDTLEDCEIVNHAGLTAEFGEDVVKGVDALTKDESKAKHIAMQESIKKLKDQPAVVQAVKLADRITNMQPPPHFWTREKKKKYFKESQSILRELGPASHYLRTRLESKVTNYQQYLEEPNAN